MSNSPLMITLNAPAAMSGMVLMQRQNHREHEGDIRAYVLQVSDDGRDWREVARGELLSTFAPQQIDFSSTVTARYLKFIALSGFGVDKTTALAELAVVVAPDADKKPKPKPSTRGRSLNKVPHSLFQLDLLQVL